MGILRAFGYHKGMRRALPFFVLLAASLAQGQLVQTAWTKSETSAVPGKSFIRYGDDGSSYLACLGAEKILIAKYLPTGPRVWGRLVGILGDHQEVTGLVVTSQGMYCSARQWTNPSKTDMRSNIIGYAVAGDPIGVIPYRFRGATSISDITADAAGNIYVVGSDITGGANDADWFVMKLEPDLDPIWERHYRAPAFSVATRQIRVGKTAKPNVYISTQDITTNSDGPAAVTKLDSYGNFLWKRTHSAATVNEPSGLELDADENVVLLTRSSSTNTLRAHVNKWNSEGTSLWTHTFSDATTARDLALFGSWVYFCGQADDAGTLRGYVRSLATTDGGLHWSTYMASSFNPPRDMAALAVDKYGQVYGGGNVGTGSSADFTVVKLKTTDGEVVFSPTYSSGSNQSDVVESMDVSAGLSDIVLVGPSDAAAPISVASFRQAPAAKADFYKFQKNFTTTIPEDLGLYANDQYVDLSQESIAVTVQPQSGAISFNENGGFVYAPDPNFEGADIFRYRVYRGSLKSAETIVNVHVGGAGELNTFTINPSSVASGSSTVGTVSFTATAPTIDPSVNVTDNSSAILTPASASLNTGSMSGSFPISTTKLAADATRTVTVSRHGISRTASLVLLAAEEALSTLNLSAELVLGGNSCTGTVLLDRAAPAGGATIGLTDSSSAITVPATITIPAGAISASFTVQTSSVSEPAQRKITAAYRGRKASALLTLTPAAVLDRFALIPNSVTGGNYTTAIAHVSVTAISNISVALSDNSSAINAPASLLVPAGYDTGEAIITTSPVASNSLRTVTAAYGGVSKTVNLFLTPPP